MINLLINGKEHSLETDPEETLLTVLRDRIGLTGTKYGCGEGSCGACTVLLDGVAAKSCGVDAGDAVGKKIETIESLSTLKKLHPVQQAFLDHQAFQCGYCTTGMIMATVSLLRKTPSPADADIIKGMNGNLCRCGTYPRIVAAVKQAAETKEAVR